MGDDANGDVEEALAMQEPILVPKPVEHALGRVALLARPGPVLAQHSVDEVGEPVKLRAANRCRASIPRRYREPKHLP